MATIYVRKTGNDANSGLTEALAKLTLSSANTAATTGDTLNIGVGTWIENIPVSKAITFQGVGLTTILQGVWSASGLISGMTFKDLRILNNVTSVPRALQSAGFSVTFHRVQVDYNGATSLANAHAWQFLGSVGTVEFRNCEFFNLQAPASHDWIGMEGGLAANGTFNLYNNVFHNMDCSLLKFQFGGIVNAYNNVFDDIPDLNAGTYGLTNNTYGATINHDYNAFRGVLDLGANYGAHSKVLTTTPFESPSTGNFNILDGAPTINAGTSNI